MTTQMATPKHVKHTYKNLHFITDASYTRKKLHSITNPSLQVAIFSSPSFLLLILPNLSLRLSIPTFSLILFLRLLVPHPLPLPLP